MIFRIEEVRFKEFIEYNVKGKKVFLGIVIVRLRVWGSRLEIKGFMWWGYVNVIVSINFFFIV